MKPTALQRVRRGAASVTRGARGASEKAARLFGAFAAWRWTGLLVRCALGVLGLVVLAAIGRSALAGAAASAAPSMSPASPASSPLLASPSPSASVLGPPVSTASTASLAAAAPDAAAARTAAATRRATPDDPVYLNQAALEDLRRLPGVGPKRALAILALRQRLGRFRQVEDLLKVKGIGRSTLKKLRPLVRLDPAP